MKKEFLVRKSITEIEGKPHVETYSEEEFIRCRDCLFWKQNTGYKRFGVCDGVQREATWYCADAISRNDYHSEGDSLFSFIEFDKKE